MLLIEVRSLNYSLTIVYYEPISSCFFLRPSVNSPSLYLSHFHFLSSATGIFNIQKTEHHVVCVKYYQTHQAIQNSEDGFMNNVS